jgi:3-phenylpropionate/trans-cinnamate dioxygenase ferredoxin reductase component
VADADSMVIIGAGMAGGTAAVTLRTEGFDGRVLLIGDEPGPPFGRPPLSKEYLRGESDLSDWLVKPADWYADHKVELSRARATRLDAIERRVTLSTGPEVRFSKLLIATGGRNRQLKVPGSELEGIHQLRTVADCEAIKRECRRDARVVLVGMGFIGSEVAASLRQLGLEVTVVLDGAVPLAKILGAEIGGVMADVHREAGVQLIPNDQVIGFEGRGKVEKVTTRRGRSVDCDLAIVAVGIEPNADLLVDTGVAIENGVLVDGGCQTSAPGIYAAGDIANHLHPLFGRIRVEHYNNAEKQPAAAARAMLGSGETYDYVHSFWSDQFAEKLEYVGHVKEWDDLVFRGELGGRRFIGFYLVGGQLRAAVGLNRGGDPELDSEGELAKAAKLIASKAQVSKTDLRDENVDLETLLHI